MLSAQDGSRDDIRHRDESFRQFLFSSAARCESLLGPPVVGFRSRDERDINQQPRSKKRGIFPAPVAAW
jgi:hypothetical protein